MLRRCLFIAGLALVAALSVDRFSTYVRPQPQPDLISQADLAGAPARPYLASRLAPGAHVSCLDLNPDWSDECDYLRYPLLPYYVKPAKDEPANQYLIFVANPHASETPAAQAAAVSHYRVELGMPPFLFLLARSEQ